MIKVKIERFDPDGMTRIWIYERIDPSRITFFRFRDGQVIGETKETHEREMSNPEPSFQVTGEIANDLMKAFADAFGEIGVVSETHEGARAELKATKHHLDDMRRLVFKQ